MALLFVAAGTSHFLWPGAFVSIVPPAVRWPLAAVYISGVLELMLGVALLVPRLSRRAALGACVLLVAVFPANVYHWLHGAPPAPAWYHFVRLPLQGLLVAWAVWLSRRPEPAPAVPPRLG